MTNFTNQWKRFVLIGFAVLSAACSSESDSPSQVPLPEDFPVVATMSDQAGAQFLGNAGIGIRPYEDGSQERYIDLRFSSFQHQGHLSVGSSGRLSESNLRDLLTGNRVVLPDSYPEAVVVNVSRSIYDFDMRRVLAATLRLESNTAIMTLELGDNYFAMPPAPGGAVTSTLEIRGQIPIGCALLPDGNLVADPSWSSEFCQAARTELGLDAWINAML